MVRTKNKRPTNESNHQRHRTRATSVGSSSFCSCIYTRRDIMRTEQMLRCATCMVVVRVVYVKDFETGKEDPGSADRHGRKWRRKFKLYINFFLYLRLDIAAYHTHYKLVMLVDITLIRSLVSFRTTEIVWKRMYFGANKSQNVITLAVANLLCTWQLRKSFMEKIELQKVSNSLGILDVCKMHILRVFQKYSLWPRCVLRFQSRIWLVCLEIDQPTVAKCFINYLSPLNLMDQANG